MPAARAPEAGHQPGRGGGYGIHDEFIRSLGATIEPGSSALFVKVLPELSPFRGTVLRASLSNAQEERLRQALQEVQA